MKTGMNKVSENQINANQVFPNENDSTNERYVQVTKLSYALKEP